MYMKRYKRLFVFTIITLMLVMTSGAAYLFKSLSNPEGLTSSQINCILKDSKGYMWFGTPSGLYRYDGYTFHNFQCNLQDGNSLPDSYIIDMQEMLDGSLMITTTSGYCIYRSSTETFERDIPGYLNRLGMSREAKLLYIDSHHNLWSYIPNKGVECFNMQQQLLYHFGYTNSSTGIPNGNIIGMGESKEGTILIYDTGRLVCCNVVGQQHTVWGDSYWEEQGMKRMTQMKAFTDSKGRVWLYGPNVLLCYDPQKQSWNTSLGDALGMGSNSDKIVYGMDEDDNGNIWMATDVEGLLKINVDDFSRERVQPVSMKTEKVIGDEIVKTQCVYVDDTNLLWVGTQKFGVAYWGNDIYKFEGSRLGDITAIAEDASGKVWYGTESDGVIGLSAPLASKNVSAMEYTKDGSLWVGSTRSGLARIKDGSSRIYSVGNDDGKTLINDNVNDLCVDKNGNLWIATNGGLQVFNPTMNTFSTYTKENGKLMSNDVTSLWYGSRNRMLVGTANGLVVMNLSNNESMYLTGNSTNLQTFSNNYITCIFEDSRGLVWIGTREGLNILDIESDNLHYIDESHGLCSNSICGITEDKNKNIWVTTSDGAARIIIERDMDEGSFTYGLNNYDESDGLVSDEFNKGTLITKKDGSILLGSMKGVNWVGKHSNKAKATTPKVILSQLFVGDQEIEPGKEYQGSIPLPTALNESRSITLDNDMNSFIIKFAAGNYNQSERLQYIYWMQGKDQGWRNADPLIHGVRFNNLGMGTYTLHVKAVSNDGNISNMERTLKITIERPWWLSWWMILVYLAMIGGFIYAWKFGFKHAKNFIRKKKQVINELVAQREEIKQASEDLRHPMARMTTIIGSLAETETSIEGREKLNSLHSQMLQIITRLSEMQISLDDPKALANERAKDKLLSGQAVDDDHLLISADGEDELTYEIKPQKKDLPTKQFLVILIDDNEEFLRFMSARMGEFYTFETYNDINKAASDLEDLKADLVICKQDMQGMTGSELCNRLKTNSTTESTKFVLLTDQVLAPADIKKQGITLSADDYMAKPFNLQEAMLHFNQLLGIGDVELDNLIESDSIKGDDKLLEFNNNSMTTAKLDYDEVKADNEDAEREEEEEEEEGQKSRIITSPEPADESPIMGKTFVGGEETTEGSPFNLGSAIYDTPESEEEAASRYQAVIDAMSDDEPESNTEISNTDNNTEKKDITLGSQMTTDIAYTMANARDRQLLENINAYVIQNMSRGQINLEELATAMGMGRVPFYHKVTELTKRTPAELIRDIRLKYACDLLEKTTISMQEVALNVGFMTSENFIRIFKEKYGMSPLEYRMKNKKG